MPATQIYSIGAIGLSLSNYTFKINFCEICGNFVKIDILSISAYSKSESKNPLTHVWRKICDYLPHTKFRFYLIYFPLNTDSPSKFYVFTVQSPNHANVTQRYVSEENAFKKSKNPSPIFRTTIGLNNSFALIENNNFTGF